MNMIREITRILRDYWQIIAIKFATNCVGYLASTDINLGGDVTGQFDWITFEGRLSLINNSSNLNNDDKSILFANLSVT